MLLAFLRRLTRLNPTRRPARVSDLTGAQIHLALVDEVHEFPPRLDDQRRVTAWANQVLGIELEPWQMPIAETRRVAIAEELTLADPRPDLERVADLAHYAQTYRAGRDEAEFAWDAFIRAGGDTLRPWAAFRAGLAASAERLRS